MSALRKLLITVLPRRWAEDMEVESRAWLVRCPSCEFERSVWDLGGVRWKARGNPRRYLTCPQCGRSGWHTVYRKQ